MAQQTVKSLLGLSDKRKKVTFDLSPQSLTPTITNGGNYPIVVQNTPKTVSALQLAEDLNRIPNVFQSYANIQMALGEERAGDISAADAEEELNRLKKEEPETYMNMIRQRAYKNSLMEKHIRGEMIPKVQQDIYKAANARIYTSENSYNNHVEAQLESAWGAFSESVGEEIAGSLDGKAVWTTLTDQIRAESKLRYYESRDAVALENEEAAIENRLMAALSDTDSEGNPREVDYSFVPKFTTATINTLKQNHGVGRGAAMKKLRVMMLNQAEVLHLRGQHMKARELRVAMDATVSSDGVSLYDSSDTAVRAARLDKAIDGGIDALDDIDQQDKAEFSGQLTSAFGYFEAGRKYDDLTKYEKNAVLAPLATLDPSYTLEDLERDMAGGTLPDFEDLRLKLSQGSDYAQLLTDLTSSAVVIGRNNASMLRGRRVHVKDPTTQAEHVERFRGKVLLDPEYTLEKYLDDFNIAVFDELTSTATSLAKTSELRSSEIYKDIESDVAIKFNEVQKTLGEIDALIVGVTPASMKTFAQSFGAQIQRILVEEVEEGTLKPELYSSRRDQLIAIATQNLMSIIKLPDDAMGSIMEQEANAPDIGIAQQPLAQTKKDVEKTYVTGGLNQSVVTKIEDEEVVEPFQTLLGKFKTIQVDSGRTAFGIIPVKDDVRVPITDEDIDSDRAEIIEGIEANNSSSSAYREALALSLNMYGSDYATDPEGTLKLLEMASVDVADVPIFTDDSSVRVFANDVFRIFKNSVIGVEKMSAEERKILEDAATMGLIPSSSNFMLEKLKDNLSQFQVLQQATIKRLK